MKQRKIIVCKDSEALTLWTAERWVQLAAHAIQSNNRFTVALAGGSTPKSLYALLATPQWSAQVAWDKVHLFWGDERHVAPNSSDSNFRMVNEALLQHLAIPAENVHRVRGEEESAERAALNYEQELREFFVLEVGARPRFEHDFAGPRARWPTASLFPGSEEALRETRRLVVAPWVEKFSAHRMTITLPVINNAAEVFFLASGPEKATKIREVLGPLSDPLFLRNLSNHCTAN
ncbi:MAG: 6-phosphogluconolactonase [Pyrinomonadaceae bacterium]